MHYRTRSLIFFLAVVLFCSGCLNGQGIHAEDRVLNDIHNGELRLTQEPAVHLAVSAKSYRVNGTLFNAPQSGAHLYITGIMQGPYNEIVNVNQQTEVRSGTTWQTWKASDEALIATRIPVQNPELFIAFFRGVATANEFGGVEVDGKAARRYDAQVTIAQLKRANDPDATRLAQLYAPYASSFLIQVDVDTKGNILRVVYPADPHASVLQDTDEGGPFDAVSVDFSPETQQVTLPTLPKVTH